MCAEVRRSGGRAYVVDLRCGFEECWQDDLIGAVLRADEHNEAMRSDDLEEADTAPTEAVATPSGARSG